MAGQASRLASIRHLIIDIDGVFWYGRQPLPGVPAFFDLLRARSVDFIIASNNSARSGYEIVQRLARQGVQVEEKHILTSAEATAMYLPRLVPSGAPIFLVGGEGVSAALVSAGYQLVEQDAAAVVVGLDLNLTYEKLKRATLEIKKGAKFVGTNGDKTFPGTEGEVPGAGAILAAIQAATDVTPITIGKPERIMFDLAVEKMGAKRAATAMLGDRLDTDIEGAKRAGLASILVLTGVTKREDLAQSAIQPDLVYENLDALREAWELEFSAY